MGMFPTKILVATDGTESAAPAIRAAAEMSAKTDSEIELITSVKISRPRRPKTSAGETETADKARELLDGIQEVVIEFDNGDSDTFRARRRDEFYSYELSQLAAYMGTVATAVRTGQRR